MSHSRSESGGGQGPSARSLAAMRAAREESNRQQFTPGQSDSERRYVSRIVQQLPEPFKPAAAPRSRQVEYQEDQDRYFGSPARQPGIQTRQQHGPGDQQQPSRLPRPQQAAGQPRAEKSAMPKSILRPSAPPQGHNPVNSGRILPGTTRAAPAPDAQADMLSPTAWPLPTSANPRAQRDAPQGHFHDASSGGRGPTARNAPQPGWPSNTASYASDSSGGDIPDFPVPESQRDSMQPSHLHSARRMQHGPPPSARRGPSSYYSRSSYVVPIAEETERNSKASYASSAAMPGKFASYYEDDYLSDEESNHGADAGGRSSRASDHDERSGLVRQASTGKKTKAALVPIRRESLHRGPEAARGGIVAQGITSAGVAGGAFAAGLGASQRQQGAASVASRNPGLTLRDLPPPPQSERSDSDTLPPTPDVKPSRSPRQEGIPFQDLRPQLRMDPAVLRNGPPFVPTKSSPLSPGSYSSPRSPGGTDYQMNAVLKGLEKGGALDEATARGLRSPRGGEKGGLRRPPRLNLDAVRDAEARGSLTSLSDLIKRATRLATNLDRGRTASRMGGDFAGFPRDFDGAGAHGMRNYRNSGSLSDILRSFPPPNLASPSGSAPPSRGAPWSGGGGKGQQHRDDFDRRFVFEKPGPRARKRCCGMPLWLFVLVCILVVAVVVAAIVAPVVIIYGNRHDDSALATCQRKLPCRNGGSSTLMGGSDGGKTTCSCLCTNGFTGSQCTTASDTACSSVGVSGGPSDATVGSAIPRLLEAAEGNFSVPLDGQKVLAQFSSSDVGCSTENALVTLDGRQSRLRRLRKLRRDAEDLRARAGTTTAAAQGPAQTDDDAFLSSPVTSAPAQTTNGIVIASGSPDTSGISVEPSTTQPSGASPTDGGSSSSSGSGNSTGGVAEDAEDFARVAILFVLQETGSFESASAAQAKLSRWFSDFSTSSSSDDGGSNGDAATQARNVSLGVQGWSLDLTADVRLVVPNGTVYGRGA